MAADVAEAQPQAAVPHGKVVEVVAAHPLGRTDRPGDVEARHMSGVLRIEPLLNQPRQLHLYMIVLGLAAFGDVPRHRDEVRMIGWPLRARASGRRSAGYGVTASGR